MDAIFKKLNLKSQKEVVAINAPGSFEVNLDSIVEEASVITSLEGLKEIEFILIFVTKQSEIDALIPLVAHLLKGDALLWMCYPKGTSKKYKCDFNRDTGWSIMGTYELEPVRMVAIDEDWSALRFKKVDFIKTMKRSSVHALSEKGRAKAKQVDKPENEKI
ncbi:hypothetical protein SAMN04487995_5758 [Dyadobacter koreensis]|uniref:DUF3052 domain-containing protein n=1 Tax=Dyadobacter koreensis TaxID=408657 RepID=A0A1H7AJS1_9BACT|nr:hypothetical protein [Dyadobacter koreensis]SEJ65166.1 hypothetical protein SAMN04487995_5758 [Dyadobacter koreensis]